MNVQIEKGIPIPKAKTEKSEFFDTLAGMEIGDSFLITHRGRFTRAKTMCSNFKARYGKQFTTRTSEQGMRIWRVK